MPFIIKKTITETFLGRVESTPNRVGFQFKPSFELAGETSAYPLSGPPSVWKTLTFREFYDQCRIFSYGLMALGIKAGDKIALLSQTRIEWQILDMAILGAQAVTVPIYPTASPEETATTLDHSDARFLFIENTALLEKIMQIRAKNPKSLPKIEKIIVIDPRGIQPFLLTQKDLLALQALRELGRREDGKFPKKFDQNLKSAKADDLFSLCYTTGTTGEPKGVPLTHANLMSVIEDCLSRMTRRIRADGETILIFLPLSHVLGRVGAMTFYAMGGRLVLGNGPDHIAADLLETRPTLIYSVPRIFERAHNQVLSAVESEKIVTRKFFLWAMGAGRAYHEAFWSGKTPSLRQSAEYALAKKLVFSKIIARFGGKLRYAICGGAPLHRELGEFFEIAGIRILEGYGLTETCAPVTLNDPDHPHFGSVGKPLAEVSIKTAEDGEILVKSKKVFQGYYKNPAETARLIRDGWFHTEDIGFLDHEGYLHITERKKDILVLSSGKKVAPQKIENLAKSHRLIREIVVYGDSRPFVTALITLDPEAVIEHAGSIQLLFSDYEGLIKSPKILGWVEKSLDEVNHRLASHERIKKFMILPQDFSVSGGELTASLKVRRNVIYERYRNEINRLYEDT